MSDDMVSPGKRRRGSGRTAAEFMAELEADPEWVAARDARARQDEIVEASSGKQQASLLAELFAAAVRVSDVWELVNTSQPYPAAIPVLLHHLHRDYEAAVLEGIARALAVTDAAPFWDEVMELFRATDPDQVRIYQGLGVALSGIWPHDPYCRKSVRCCGIGPLAQAASSSCAPWGDSAPPSVGTSSVSSSMMRRSGRGEAFAASA
jgi:hypothetical protein